MLADPAAYAEAAALPKTDDAAERRRDLAVRGYLPLREALLDAEAAARAALHRAARLADAAEIGDCETALAGRGAEGPQK